MIETNLEEIKVIDTNESEILERIMEKAIIEYIKSLDDPFKNLTVVDVAKDLKMGINNTNEIFKRADFPSVCVGKTKYITLLSYLLWKSQKREKEVVNNANNK